MTLMLSIVLLASLLEFIIWLPGVWQLRKPISRLFLFYLVMISCLILVASISITTLLLTSLMVYRLVNLSKIVENRIHESYLRRTTIRSATWLAGSQVGILLYAEIIQYVAVPSGALLVLLAGLQLTAALLLLSSSLRHLRTSRPPQLLKAYVSKDLPTLSVLIPARNETDDLEACLQSLIASTYPKLEIIVLDDCSQNKRTPEIIRSFAHDGVRFIAGEVAPEEWLAKNYAYKLLAAAASGDYLLFCGVDTRFNPGSLHEIMETMLEKHKTMISLLPKNTACSSTAIGPLLVQPARYAWELALPRRWFERPPVLSTCWVIKKTCLLRYGSFAAVSRSILPERYLARQAARADDGYSFLCSDSLMAVESAKRFTEQQATAIRTRYPLLHHRIELVALQSLLQTAMLIAPIGLTAYGIVNGKWLVTIVALAALLVNNLWFGLITRLTYRRALLNGFWLLPVAAVYDLGLLQYSMWRYEFDEVTWKGRNICLPVMHVYPNLPGAAVKD